MGRFFAVLLSIFSKIFGTWKIDAPPWLQWLKTKLARFNTPRNRKFGMYGVGAIVVLGVGAYFLQMYLDSLPKPEYVTVRVSGPYEPNPENRHPMSVEFEFSTSVAPLDKVGKPVTEGIDLSPKMKGEWMWVSDRELKFTPVAGAEGEWVPGKTYEVEFSKKTFVAHAKFETHDYKFTPPALRASVWNSEFYQDPTDPKIKRALYKIHYNYEVDVEDLKKRVQLSFSSIGIGIAGKSHSFRLSTGKYNNEIYVTSEPIPIPDSDMQMELIIAKGVRTAKGDAKLDGDTRAKVEVPGLNTYFRFTNAEVSIARNAKYEPEQVLILETKAEVASEVVGGALELFMLPEQNPDYPEPKARRGKKPDAFGWNSPGEVTRKVREKLEPVKFTVIPTEQESSQVHSFKVDVPPGRYVYLKVKKGIKSFGGYALAQDYESVVLAPEFTKELLVMSQGSLLSYSGERKVPLLARNVSKIKYNVARILPEHLNWLIVQVYGSGSDFTKPSLWEGILNRLSERYEKEERLPVIDPRKTQYFHFDLDTYLQRSPQRKGVFYFEVAEKGQESVNDQRLIVLTDLGIVAKENAYNGYDVFVQNIRTGAAVAGAEVQVLGTNGLPVIELQTDGNGKVSLPDLSEFKNEKEPIAFVARSGNDFSFMPFHMSTRELNLSRFDTGGIYENKDTEKLVAYVFSDRGIYRPGEAAKLGLIVRSRNTKNKFQDLPLFWSVIDARGTEILRERLRVGSQDLVDLQFSTEDSAPTGTYEVRVFLTKPDEADQLIGSTTVRVEEFLPDKLKISANISGQKSEGWISPKDVSGLVTLRNLFGTPAENRKISGEMMLIPAQPSFSGYSDYRFTEFRHKVETLQETLEDTTSDSKGEATFALDLARFSAAMYTLRFDAEGFEGDGGRSVRAAARTLVSPLPYLVGYKTDSDLNYLKLNSNNTVELIAINSDLKKIDVNDAQVVLYEKAYVSSLMKDSNGVYRYQSVMKEMPLKTEALKIAAKGTMWAVPTDKAGDFSLQIKNSKGDEVHRVSFTVIGEANLARSLERTSELQLVLNKKDYQPQDEIEMQIKAPYVGSGLITIERDRVYSHKWFHTDTTSTVQRVAIPAGLEGNAYVSVTFLRDSKSREIFMSPLSYAVAPFSISLESRRIAVNLKAPQKVKPGQKLEVRYSSNKPAKIVLYGVDEGILQVAGYKLPDPVGFFFQRRALQVRTFQLLDLAIPEFSLLQDRAAPGGDSDAALGRNLNPFKRKGDKPVVFWSGVLSVGPGEKVYSFNVPEYFNGNMRIMAVAASEFNFGATATDANVRGDYILSPSVPVFVANGDEFEVNVGVANQEEKSGEKAQVTVRAEVDSRLAIVGDKSQTAQIAEGREGLLKFRFKANPSFGDASIRFVAQGVKASAQLTSHLSVRPAMPYEAMLIAGLAEDDEFEVPITRQLQPEFRKQEAGVSILPLILSRGLKLYLDDYPYLCTEQLLSKAIPYIVLSSYPEFKIDQVKARESFNNAMRVLRSRQADEGGFALYTGGPANEWATLHAIHFLIEAKSKGFPVPADFLKKSLSSLEVGARSDFTEANLFSSAYGIYLLAREGQVRPQEMKFLRDYVKTEAPKFYETSLGGVYMAATLKLYKQDTDALAILKSYKLPEETYYGLFDGFSRDGAYVNLVARHFPEQLKSLVTEEKLRAMLKPLQRGSFNTFSSAQWLYAIDGFSASEKAINPGNAAKSITAVGADNKKTPLTLSTGLMQSGSFTGDVAKLLFQVPDNLPYYYFVNQSGFDKNLPDKPSGQHIEIQREYVNAKGDAVTKVNVGDEVVVRIRARSTRGDDIPNIVIVDLMPGGFEPILDATVATSGGMSPLNADFVDRREDRMVVYGSVTKEGGEFSYKAKAISRGSFVVPPSFGQSMYDSQVVARGAAGRISVE